MTLRVADLRSARRHDGEPSLTDRAQAVLADAQRGQLLLSSEDCATVMRHLSGVIATLERSVLAPRQ